MKKTKNNSIAAIILHHIDAHQKANLDKYHLERRTALLREELTQFRNNNTNNNSHDDDDDDDDADADADALVSILCQCFDCVIYATAAMENHTANNNNNNNNAPGDFQESINRVLELVAVCCSPSWLRSSSFQCESESSIADSVLRRIIQFTVVAQDRVRAQACHALKYIWMYHNDVSAAATRQNVNHDENQNQNDQLLYEITKQALLSRLTDKSQHVRAAAIAASAHLMSAYPDYQKEDNDDDDDDDDGTLLTAFLWNMVHDPSANNRQIAVESVAAFLSLSKHDADNSFFPEVVDAVIGRIRDVKVKIREAAIQTLAKAMPYLSREHHATVIRYGLTGRCAQTSEATIKLICAGWLKGAKYNVVALLDMIGPIMYEPECEKMLLAIFQNVGNNKVLGDLSHPEIRALKAGAADMPSVINITENNTLSPAAVLMARVKCSQAHADTTLSPAKKASILARAAPDIPMLCEAIRVRIQRIADLVGNDENEDKNDDEAEEEETFICNQLLKIAKLADLKEEGSRRHFKTEMVSMLLSIQTSDELLEEGVQALGRTHDKEQDFVSCIANIIEDMNTKENNTFIRLRIVSILTILFENTSSRMAGHNLLKNFVEHVIAAVTDGDSLLREAGVGCLGRLALLSEPSVVLQDFKPLLLRIIANSDEKIEIRAQAMLAVSDLTMLFENMLDPITLNGEDDTPVSLVELLQNMLQNSNYSVVAIAVEVATKLLHAGKITDKQVVANLLMIFFNKNIEAMVLEEDDDTAEVGSLVRMEQILTAFFPAYSMKSQNAKEALISAIGPMLTMATNPKNGKRTRGGGANRTRTYPLVKMIEFVYGTAEVGSKETEDDMEDDETNDNNENKDGGVMDDDAAPKAKNEASSALLVCIELSTFLLKNSDSINVTTLRSLSKLLGGADVIVEEDNPKKLVELKQQVEDLSTMIVDATALENLETMGEVLEDVDVAAIEEEEALTQALEAIKVIESKENVDTSGQPKRAKGMVDDESPAERSVLGEVN